MEPIDLKVLEYNFHHPDEVIEMALNSVEHQKMIAQIEKERVAHYLSLKKAEEPIK